MQHKVEPNNFFYRTVVEQSPLSTVVLRADGSVMWVNQAYQDMWGIRGDALKALFTDYNMLQDPALETEGVSEYIRRGFNGETVQVPVIHYEPIAGSAADVGVKPRWCKACVYPLLNANGDVQEVVVVHEDVTDRVEAEKAHRELTERLQRSQQLRAVGQLSGGIAHDFNNLLTIIACHVEFVSDPGSREESVQTIRETVASAASLTQRFLALSGGAGVCSTKGLTEISTLLRDVTETLRRTLGQHVRIEFSATPEPTWIHANAAAIQHVFVNLCINSRDAMPDGGCIRIEFETSTSNVSVRVTDNGHGMSDEVRLRAFEPFFTTKEVGRGTGLGLVMARETMVAHGGTVELETCEGEGTTIVLSFPRVQPPSSTLPEGRPLRRRGRDEHILLADDNEEVREALAMVLRGGGYRVSTAGDGREALELFRDKAEDIALIVSDVVMPHLGGPGLIRSARATKPNQKALFMSGLYDRRASEDIRSLSVELLPKPLGRQTILEGVSAALARETT